MGRYPRHVLQNQTETKYRTQMGSRAQEKVHLDLSELEDSDDKAQSKSVTKQMINDTSSRIKYLKVSADRLYARCPSSRKRNGPYVRIEDWMSFFSVFFCFCWFFISYGFCPYNFAIVRFASLPRNLATTATKSNGYQPPTATDSHQQSSK